MKGWGFFYVGRVKWAEGEEGRLKDMIRRSRNYVEMLGKVQAFELHVLQILQICWEKQEKKKSFPQSLDFVITTDHLGLFTAEEFKHVLL